MNNIIKLMNKLDVKAKIIRTRDCHTKTELYQNEPRVQCEIGVESNIEFLENGIAALNQAIIDRMKSETCPAELSFDEGEYFVWKQPEPNKIYTIGVDVAEGVGQDFTVATVLDITDLDNIEQTAIFASNKIQPWIFAEKLNFYESKYL